VTIKINRSIYVPAGRAQMQGDLMIPEHSTAIAVFAHGSGSSRHSPRNKYVAQALNEAGISTLLIDLLTADEELLDIDTGQLRFDIVLLANRLSVITSWIRRDPSTQLLHIGYFGASTGAAAALAAAARHPETVEAIVCRGGRPDLAGPDLGRVRAPTLLISVAATRL